MVEAEVNKVSDTEIEGIWTAQTHDRARWCLDERRDELRALIADQYEGASDASVLVTTGGAEANFTCFWHLFEGDAKAAIVLPTYGQVPGLLESFGSRLTGVNLREEDDWQPDLDALEAALADGASFVLITNPNNPTGASLTRASM